MSLLMDALKRAEQARQAQAAEQGGQSRDPAETQGLTLDPLEPLAGPGEVPTTDGELPEALRGFDFDRAEAQERSGAHQQPTPADSGPQSFEDASGPQAAPGEAFRPDDSGGFTLADEMRIEDTSDTLPSLKAAQASVDDYFDGTRSVSMSLDESQLDLAAGGDTITAEREAVQADRGAARAVFDAKAPLRRPSRHWASAGFLLLVLLGMLCGGVFLYWDQLGELIGGEPAVVASRRPPVVPRRVEPAPAPAPSQAAQRAPPEPRTAAAEPLPVPIAPTVAEVLAAAPEPEAAALPIPVPTPPRVRAADAAPVRAPAAAAPPAAMPEPARAALPLALQPGALQDGELLAGSMQISRRSRPAVVPALLQDAYRAYQAGDDEAAYAAYRKLLERVPNNRDAAVGLAAVAVRTGDWTLAEQLYMRVLTRNPRDSLATAGIIALTENLDPGAAESRVKTMLAAEPGAAHLHFTLGNLYAAQGRWPEAQQSYFDAFRLDDANADYAFNLAVSLDKLAQRKTALEYYRLALDLATRRPASFDTASVTERIRIMAAAGES